MGSQKVTKHRTVQEIQEMRDHSLTWEDPLEKEMATYFSPLAREVPWTEEPGRPQPKG